jgi:hypothetical protein
MPANEDARLTTMNFLRWIKPAAVLAALLWLAGCAGLGGPRVFTFSEADITRALERHAPFERRFMELLDVQIAAPRVRLLPESNRVATEMDVSTSERLSGRAYQGRIAFDFGVRYDDSEGAIRLNHVRVSQFQIDNAPPAMQSRVNRLGGLIAEQLMENLVLYRFKPADLKTAEGLGLRPGSLAVTARGVEVTLAPISR